MGGNLDTLNCWSVKLASSKLVGNFVILFSLKFQFWFRCPTRCAIKVLFEVK